MLLSPPQFTAFGSLYLGEAQTSGADAGAGGLGFLSAFQSVSDVETQIELISSEKLLENAVLETGLNTNIVPVGSTPLSYWHWRIFEGKQISAFAPVPGALSARFAAFDQPVVGPVSLRLIAEAGNSYQIVQPNGWLSTNKIILQGQYGVPASGGGLSLVVTPAIPDAPPPAGKNFIITVTPARIIADSLIGSKALSISAGGTLASPTKNATVLMLWPDPYQATNFVNTLMRDFIATQLSWKTEAASSTENFITDQLEKIRTSLESADDALATYQSKTGILDVPENAKAAIDQLSQLEVQRTTAILQQQALQQLADELEHHGPQLNPYLVSQSSDEVLGRLAEQLATAQAKLQGDRVQFTSEAPEIQVEEATIYKLESAITTLVSNDLKLSNGKLDTLNSQIATFDSALKSMPAQSLRVISLSRNSNVLGQLYVLLMEKQEEAEVSKAATIIDTRIVTPAQLPYTLTAPRPKFAVLVGFFLGLAGSVGFVLGRRALSTRFQTEDEIRRLVPLPVYGLIPRRPPQDVAAGIFPSRAQSPFAEAIRLLRSNIYRSTPTKGARVIAITSAAADDGKTTIACNLAKMLSCDGKRVIAIDADLYRGSLHEALGLEQAPGLTEWLITGNTLKFQSAGFEVVPCGARPPNPSELLNGADLAGMIQSLRATFDFIIIDCPPLPLVSDTLTIGRFADLVLSVVKIEHTQRAGFVVHAETLSHLQHSQGIVINGVIASGYGRDYHYGYGELTMSPEDIGTKLHGWKLLVQRRMPVVRRQMQLVKRRIQLVRHRIKWGGR